MARSWSWAAAAVCSASRWRLPSSTTRRLVDGGPVERWPRPVRDTRPPCSEMAGCSPRAVSSTRMATKCWPRPNCTTQQAGPGPPLRTWPSLAPRTRRRFCPMAGCSWSEASAASSARWKRGCWPPPSSTTRPPGVGPVSNERPTHAPGTRPRSCPMARCLSRVALSGSAAPSPRPRCTTQTPGRGRPSTDRSKPATTTRQR